METSKRRLSCPLTVQLIWDSIANLRLQRQISNRERIYKTMSKQHKMTMSDVERQLKYAVRDNLISCVRRVGVKGNRKGVVTESYWFFNEELKRDSHDWYCFECHRSGEVYSCESCFRVYHPFCVKEDVSSLSSFICPICKMLKSEIAFETSKKDLNVLLGYTCDRLKEKPTRDSVKQVLLNEDKWRQERLIFQPMDLLLMAEKAAACLYNRIEEYEVDAQTIVHNVVIYYGVHSSHADLARQMLRDCKYDLNEIQQCKNCYKMSNEKLEKLWFCQPCNPPHELVYAKQRGYPYWPAKVIKKLKDAYYDVRFFGAFHQRAKVEKLYVKPITVNINSLHVKRSLSWNKAVEELRKHQEILAKHKLVPITTLESKDDSESENEDCAKAKKPFLEMDILNGVAEMEKLNRVAEIEKLNGVADTEKLNGVADTEKLNGVADTEKLNGVAEMEKLNGDVEIKKLNEVVEMECDDVEEEDSEHSARPDYEEMEARDDINVVSSSSQVSRNIKYRNVYSQTRDLQKRKASSGSLEVANLNSTNMALMDLREQMQADFNNIKKSSLRDLTAELDKKHFKQFEMLAKIEREKRMQLEERLKEQHSDQMKELNAKHAQEISEAKKKQWCWNCDNEAIYHCCWNTSYCCTKCQQTHWQNEHKFTCRHKR